MNIVTAKHAGFCFGVSRAVEEATGQVQHEHQIFTYGPLIHNETVIKQLEAQGIGVADPAVLEAGGYTEDTILIRAHGVGRRTEEKLRARCKNVIDATCPFVKKIHKIVDEHSRNGEQIVIIGAASHPEVIGIRGWVTGESYVVSTEEEAEKLVLDPQKKTCIVSQTTFHFNKFQDFVEIIKQKVYDITAFNTICNATEERQREASQIAAQVDAMLVIGGENSSNSKKLYEICRRICPNTFFLQTQDDVDLATLQPFESIGITAGASTPHYIIEEVQKKCQK